MNKLIKIVICSASAVAIAGADLEERVSALENAAELEAQTSRLALGGYGEFHLTNNDGQTYGDYHRVVLYAGYQFNDWIRLNSEIELEHAKAGKGSSFSLSDVLIADGTTNAVQWVWIWSVSGKSAADGYVLLEQFSVDLQVTETTAIRLGRTLAPLGIVGPRHEPPLFFGVERPNLEKHILPSTWSVDGAGLVGDLSENISYEIYAVAGIDGGDISKKSAIRSGREPSYPGFNSPSITGRADYHGIDGLRIGAGFYQGSTDAGYKDKASGTDEGEVSIMSLDFEAEVGSLTLNGLWAAGSHDGNGDDVDPSDFGGYYLTAGYEVWRDGEKAIIPFVRLGEYDSYEASNGANEVESTQFGLHVPLSDQFCLKADILEENDDQVLSMGFGMMFQ